MSDTITSLFKTREDFVKALNSGMLPQLDFSNQKVQYDFSGLTISDANFSYCDLSGSNFDDARLIKCHFDISNWSSCSFFGTRFQDCFLSGVKGTYKAHGLHTATGSGRFMNFETAQRALPERFLDWERLGLLGKLPFFSASSAALVIFPIYFYLIDLYNRHFIAWKTAYALRGSSDNEMIKVTLDALIKAGPLKIPEQSLALLFSVILLFLASAFYSFGCPDRTKQFTREQWTNQLQKSLIEYWPISWRRRWLRVFCALFFVVGGAIGAFILATKLWYTATYIWQNA